MGLDGQLEWIDWVGDIIPGRDGPENFGILKKTGVEFQPSKRAVLSGLISLGLDLERWVEITTRRCAWVGGYQHSMVCIDFHELCLSPRVAKDWR